jgi:tripartite-type tricarboxylate transporter receptor subunit TctC
MQPHCHATAEPASAVNTDRSRRQVVALALAGWTLCGLPRWSAAQAYPARPVKIIVGYPAGGPIDIVARIVGQALSDRMGQPFIVENRPGAGGNVGAETVVRAPADGHTLLLVGSNNFINATLYSNLRFSFVRDIAPIGGIGRTPLVMEVHPSVPATSVREFVAHAKGNPGKLNMASGGVGTPVHMAGELFKMMAGVHLVHIPYRGSAPALADLIGGQVQVMFDTVSSSIEHIHAGRLRPLAVTTVAPLDVLPGVPSMADAVPGYEVNSVQGLGAPRGTPADIIDKLHAALSDALADSTVRGRFAALGIEVLRAGPAEFSRLIAGETDKWAKVVAFAGAKAE